MTMNLNKKYKQKSEISNLYAKSSILQIPETERVSDWFTWDILTKELHLDLQKCWSNDIPLNVCVTNSE